MRAATRVRASDVKLRRGRIGGGTFGKARQTMTRAYPLDRARAWCPHAEAPIHSVRTPAGITLAESDHLRFAVGSDTVVRPPRPSALIRKHLVNRCERATPELVQIAAAHVILRGHLGYMLSPEQRHDSPHTLRVPGRDKRIIAHLRYC